MQAEDTGTPELQGLCSTLKSIAPCLPSLPFGERNRTNWRFRASIGRWRRSQDLDFDVARRAQRQRPAGKPASLRCITSKPVSNNRVCPADKGGLVHLAMRSDISLHVKPVGGRSFTAAYCYYTGQNILID
jgi:hypothetical protein